MAEGSTEALTEIDGESAVAVVTREALYALVWKEPMLRIGARFGVSSSYMARVCAELRVPRPPRGHWAQLEVGKAPDKLALPTARPGDLADWSPGNTIGTMQRSTANLAEPVAPAAPRARRQVFPETRHELLTGVKPHFFKTRNSETGLLRPFKRMLVDIIASEKHLDAALDAADILFRALTRRGHHVTLASSNARLRRAKVDVREAPKENHYDRREWSPDRSTIVYLGETPIGLTLFEMTEEVEVMYVNGEYIPVRNLTSEQLRKFKGPHHWTTTRDDASGRLCLQAYCPYWRVSWTRQWREAKAGQFAALVPSVVRELEAAGADLAGKLELADKRAEEERIRREEETRRRREAAERARQVKAHQDARLDLLAAISAWDEALRIHEYFEAAERALGQLPESEQQDLRDRLIHARALVGEVDALEYLRQWKAPHER